MYLIYTSVEGIPPYGYEAIYSNPHWWPCTVGDPCAWNTHLDLEYYNTESQTAWQFHRQQSFNMLTPHIPLGGAGGDLGNLYPQQLCTTGSVSSLNHLKAN